MQRCYALLPAFLACADGRPLDLIELGPSAGLNLLWDRYAYAYEAVPTITALMPAAGGTGGGTVVTLSGTSLTRATSVRPNRCWAIARKTSR